MYLGSVSSWNLRQFDEWIWLNETEAVTPITGHHRAELAGVPDTFPFGL